MSNRPLCPMKFPIAAGGLHIVDNLDWGCQQEDCAWWGKSKERCVIVTLAMALWASVDIAKGKLPDDQ